MILSAEDVSRLLPPRNPWAHKGDFGKLLLLCGSRGYTGAAYFAAMGALRSGAGLVFLCERGAVRRSAAGYPGAAAASASDL